MGNDETTETKAVEPPVTQSSSGDVIEIKPNIKPGFARDVSASNADKSSHSYILDGMPNGNTEKRKKQRAHPEEDDERKRSKKPHRHKERKKRKKRHHNDYKTTKRKFENEKQNQNQNKTQNKSKNHNESLRAMFEQKYTQRPQMQSQSIAKPNYINHGTIKMQMSQKQQKEKEKQKAKSKSKPALALMPIYSTDDGDAYDKSLTVQTDGRDGRHGHLANPMRMIDEHSQNIWNQVFDGDCSNATDCIAIQRIIRALKWYTNVRGDGDKVWKKIKDRNYGTNLISDYHHLLHSHLDKGDAEKIKIRNEYQIEVGCNEATCSGYQRKLYRSNDNDMSHVPFYVSCLDTIHCLFVH